MLLKDFIPKPVLKDYVQFYRIVHFNFTEHQPIPVKAYPPKPENCLIFYLTEPDVVQFFDGSQKQICQRIVLTGQQTKIVKRFPSRNMLNFQIVFQPTTIFQLLGISSTEIINQYIDAESLFSKEISILYRQLQAATTHAEMIELADNFIIFLVKRSKFRCDRIPKVSQLMLHTGGNISLDWLSKEACYSIKQFRRKFVEQVGINPQYYSRIIRFTQAFNLHNKTPDLDWLSVALETGYYDYQHLAKDYKEFSYHTPIEFSLLESQSPERVLGIANEVYKSRCRVENSVR